MGADDHFWPVEAAVVGPGWDEPQCFAAIPRRGAAPKQSWHHTALCPAWPQWDTTPPDHAKARVLCPVTGKDNLQQHKARPP